MNTSSSTPQALKCPDFCVDRDSSIHRAGEDDLSIRDDGSRAIFRHRGPRFGGWFETYADVDVISGQTEVLVFVGDDLGDQDITDPVELRAIAAAAHAAADWLEDNR